MSALATTVPRMTAPRDLWRRLRDLRGWELQFHQPDEDPDAGYTLHDERVISLRVDLSWTARRCTLLHECLHAEHGPVLTTHLARHENAVRRDTARLLLPDVRAVGEALAWGGGNAEAAAELHVDVDVLRDRLRWLHPAERGYLERRLKEI